MEEKYMTSRERLLCALKGEIPDRVPVSCYELVGYDTRNFCNREPSYKNLMDYIREKTDCICMWDPASNEKFLYSAADPGFTFNSERLNDGWLYTSNVEIAGRKLQSRTRTVDGIYTSWSVEPLCKDIDDVDALMTSGYIPVKYDNSDFARISDEVGEHGIIMAGLSDPAYMAMTLMEFGESMVWVMTETEHFESVVKELHRRNMINIKEKLETTSADIYRICGPEYICPPYLPPKYFERFELPYLSEIVDLVHSYGRMVRIHCHGRIGQVIDMIAETGCDATDPCEEYPDGDTTLEELKKRVGGRLCLHGSMQLKTLERADGDTVRRETERMMKAGKPGGRFVIMPTAAPINVPLSPQTEENYRIYIDTALSMADY